jgi:predicted nucleic acid-binding protein
VDVNRIVQISSTLSAQRNAIDLNVAMVKLGNDQMKAQGEAVMQLIEAIPQAVANVGNTINIAV